MIEHVFGELPKERLELHDRICRPGAAFGPDAVEERMGVRRCVHLDVERIRGGFWRCKTCRSTGT